MIVAKPEYLSATDAARRFKISRSSIAAARKSGALRFDGPGRLGRTREDWVQDWLRREARRRAKDE